MKPNFLDKVIGRLDRISPEDLQVYLLRLAEEKGFLEGIFNALHEGVLVTDAEGRIKFLNHSATRLLGFQEDKALGMNIARVIKGLDWKDLTTPGQSVSRDLEVFYPEPRLLNFYIVPLGEETRSQVGYAIILRDITETRKLTEEAIESEKINAVMMLAASVAHELGNPLNSIGIHLQLIERDLKSLPPEKADRIRQALGVCRGEISRLDHIISQFLQAVRPTQPDFHSESVNAVVREAVGFLKPELDNRGILVELKLDENLPRVLLDAGQLKQVFYNVIRNAQQAMKEGGILDISTSHNGTHAVVAFSDTGGGIPPEKLSRIFQPFYTTKEKGSGLGLMIVRRIVREHGGEISIESRMGNGTTFKVLLPLQEHRMRLLEDRPQGTADHATSEGGV